MRQNACVDVCMRAGPVVSVLEALRTYFASKAPDAQVLHENVFDNLLPGSADWIMVSTGQRLGEELPRTPRCRRVLMPVLLEAELFVGRWCKVTGWHTYALGPRAPSLGVRACRPATRVVLSRGGMR